MDSDLNNNKKKASSYLVKFYIKNKHPDGK